MLEVLHDMPVSGDLGKCELDPQGPGFWFHVFEDPFQNLACYLRERRLGPAAYENAMANNRALMHEFERILPNGVSHFVRMLRISQRDGVQGWAHMEKRKKLEHHVIYGPARETARNNAQPPAPHRRGDEGIERTPVVNAVRKDADDD